MRRLVLIVAVTTLTGCAGGIPPLQFSFNQPPPVVYLPDTTVTLVVQPAPLTPITGGFVPRPVAPEVWQAVMAQQRQPEERGWNSPPSLSGGSSVWTNPSDEMTVQTAPPPPGLVDRVMSPSGIPYLVRERRRMVMTAYNSDPSQTDGTPWRMADGRMPVPGSAACNGLAIGTRFRIPELFGDNIFTVDDRMAGYIGNDHVDVWVYHIGDAYSLHHPTVTIEVLDPPRSFAPR